MSILPLLMLVGVAFAKLIVPHDNDAKLQPIASPSQIRRICAELCMSGLGGEACGKSCLDISPQGFTLQSANYSTNSHNTTRRDACSVLCPNQLGYPLCQCNNFTQRVDKKFKVNFLQICSYFCLKHIYQIHGCQPCETYEKLERKFDVRTANFISMRKHGKIVRQDVDWQAWCRDQCNNGNGGAACNCDKLPFRFGITEV